MLGARLAMVGNESILLTFGGPAKPALHLKPLESRTAMTTAVLFLRGLSSSCLKEFHRPDISDGMVLLLACPCAGDALRALATFATCPKQSQPRVIWHRPTFGHWLVELPRGTSGLPHNA